MQTLSHSPYTTLETGTDRVAVHHDFAWDECDAYLFDIDGTLLRDPSRMHYHAFSESAERVLGHPLSLEGVQVHGSLDPAILRDALLASGKEEALWRPKFQELLSGISDIMQERAAAMQIVVMPGVREMLRYLRSQGKLLGVGTGNLATIGWLKIEHAGLREWFSFGGFSDDFEERGQMIGAAAQAARTIAGPDASVCVIGDTHSDIAAARANALPVIVVATGRSSFDDLLAHEPEVCTTTLSALLQTVGSPLRKRR